MNNTPRNLTVHFSKTPPRDKESFLWIHYNENNELISQIYTGEVWENVSSSGGSGGEGSLLEYPGFYGGSDIQILNSEYAARIIRERFASSMYSVVKNIPNENKWFYICVCPIYSPTSVITENGESIIDGFNLTDIFVPVNINGNVLMYRLYEYHLDSDIPLDVKTTITISKV